MSTDIRSFYLPDLGEGLAEAEIVQWYVKEGDKVTEDDPILSVETAKALVDVPSPVTGIIKKIHVADNSLVPTHCLLAEFEVHATVHGTQPMEQTKPQIQVVVDDAAAEAAFQKNRTDSATVVGKMNTTTQVSDDYFIIGKNRQKQPEREPLSSPYSRYASPQHSSPQHTGAAAEVIEIPVLHSHTASSTTLPTTTGSALSTHDLFDIENIRGSRRTMADAMELSHQNVAQVTLFDQADITSWFGKKDVTSKLVHAISEAAKEVPRLNAWFDMEKRELHIHHHVNLGIAVDTEDGLFVPVLHQINRVPQYKIRDTLNQVIEEVKNRTASPDRFKRATFTLSNFGAIAGRFATPMVVPPAVSILGAGRYFETPVAEMSKKGKPKLRIRKMLPLSLSFDHRAATGGEGARFLKCIIRELEQ